jgi:hypothetical protein
MKKKTRRKADSTRMGLGCSERRGASDGLRKDEDEEREGWRREDEEVGFGGRQLVVMLA